MRNAGIAFGRASFGSGPGISRKKTKKEIALITRKPSSHVLPQKTAISEGILGCGMGLMGFWEGILGCEVGGGLGTGCPD